MNDDFKPQLRGTGRDCEMCGEPILDGDVIVSLDAGPTTAVRHSSRWTPAHIACTKDGVERWNRENRPNRSPLLWDRAERPTWTAAGADREPGEAATRRGYVRRSTSARVRQSDGGPRAGDR